MHAQQLRERAVFDYAQPYAVEPAAPSSSPVQCSAESTDASKADSLREDRATIEAETGADSGPLSPERAERAASRNPALVGRYGISPADVGTSTGPESVAFAQAVARFQQQRGLAVDGVVGAKTAAALSGNQARSANSSTPGADEIDARGSGSTLLQMRSSAGVSGEDGIRGIAAAGIARGGAALPHRDPIQRAFGVHDVSGIRAHVGGAAAAASEAIGAKAFASGDHTAFRQAPDLHTAAHEAAHVVQQRGGVQLDGGVGRAGDVYEQHADAVADAVVRGDSAEALLDPVGRGRQGTGNAAPLQRKEMPDSAPDGSLEQGGGAMAIEDFIRESVAPTLSIDRPELRQRADRLVRKVTHWPAFINMVIGSHEWDDDPIGRAVFVRYFSEIQRTYWAGGESPSRATVLGDVVKVELAFWAHRSQVDLSPKAGGGQAPAGGDEPGGADTGAGVAPKRAAERGTGTTAGPGGDTEASDSMGGVPTPQAIGSGLVVFYDSMQRLSYARTIRRTAQEAVVEIGTAEKLGDLGRAEQAARGASAQRNYQRSRTQARVTPGARMMSNMLEQDRSWDSVFDDHRGRPGNQGDPFKTYESIAQGSGRTNKRVLTLAKVGAVIGPLGAVASAGMSGDAILSAPAGQRERVASEEIGGAIGGGIGSVVGGAVATTALALLLGSNPAGWIVIGASILGGAAGGMAGSEAGRRSGGGAYGAAMQVGDAVGFVGEHIADEIHDSGGRKACASEYAPPDVCAGVDGNRALTRRLGYDPERDDD